MDGAEEPVFWILSVVCEDLFPDYFGGGMTMLKTDLAVLDDIFVCHLPELCAEFKRVSEMS